MRKARVVTAAIGVAVIFFAWAMLPPKPRSVPPIVGVDLQRRTVAGAYHVHSTRSDGAADKNTIALAASRAGLAFVILTDHGDGTRASDPPEFLHGVLCIDAVEISTTGGHYVALDMQPAAYPLGGEPSAVVEDVHRLGGFGIAAHPDSPRHELAWTDWNLPIDGIEWLSADSEWRDESRVGLARVLAGYVLRPAPALALMLDRPVATLERWDALTSMRRVVGLAAHDAHGGIGRGVEEGGARRAAIGGVPSYEASFRTFSNRVVLDAAFSSDAATAARQVLEAIEQGRVFTVVDAIATPGFVEVRDAAGREVPMGSIVEASAARVLPNISMPPGGVLSHVGSGSGDGALSSAVRLRKGATRFEVSSPGAPGTPPVPWLVTNPLYVLPEPDQPSTPAAEMPAIPLPADAVWHVEKDPGSTATLTVSGGQATLAYTLLPGGRVSQFAALATDLATVPGQAQGIGLTASAQRPGRVSIQLRYPQQGGVRWGTSVYVDPTPRHHTITLDRLRPLDRQPGPAPDPTSASALLVVADLTNARPGDSNVIHVSNVSFVSRPPPAPRR
jgi:hypothetical protein